MVLVKNALTYDFYHLRAMDPRGVSNDHRSSNSDLDFDDVFRQFLLLMSFVEYESQHFFNQPCRTIWLTRKEYVIEILNGHEDKCYYLII